MSAWSVLLSVALLAAALARPLVSQGRALALEDYYRVRSVGAPALSPDGRWVAFTVSRRIEANNGDSSEVWLVASDAARPAQRVSAVGRDARSPRWYADGRLGYVSNAQTWTLDPAAPDSGTRLPVPRDPGRGGMAGDLPSPDGKWVAVVRSMRPETTPRALGSEFEQRHEARFKGQQFDWLDFQRDGATFPVPNPADPAVTPPQEIVISPRGGGPDRQTRLGLRPQGVQWNPGGTALLFTADSSYRDELRYDQNQIWEAALDGSVRRLSRDPELNYTGASYSPDGRWILYTRQLSTDAVIARKLSHGGPTDLAVLPAGGGPERLLTGEWDYLPQDARWSRDGRQIYFVGGLGGTTQLFRVSPEGGPVEQLTRGERRLAGFSFDREMTRMAFTVAVMESPAELAIADIDGKNERLLTRVHAPFTTELALETPERLLYPSTDGTRVEGWLYRPHGYRAEGGPYPLVVWSHGGPHAAYGYGFDFRAQYLAANGYFVLSTNFRSSTGYGEQFLWATWGGWGNRDGEDVMAGIDHVISRYPIDPKRVGTTGHSYGGFLSNWLITQYPDRFAAAAVGAGIVNWVSDYGTADIARTKETEFYGTPWQPEAQALMMRQSPLSYANRVKAATLFIHGEVDQRVPYSEAEQMFVALKKNGIPAKVILYAGQPHGISGSWNIVHRLLHELRWFNTWLKPAARRQAGASPQ